MAEIEERMPHFDPAKHTTEDVVRQDWERTSGTKKPTWCHMGT